MIELLSFVFVVVIVIVAVRIGRQDDAQTFTDRTTATTSNSACGLSDSLAFAMQYAEQKCDSESVQAIDNGTYTELLEQRASKRVQTITADDDIYSYSISGINYRKGIAAYIGRSTGYIKPEPTNIHDPNAIAVYADDGHNLGYIPADETDDVRDLRLRFPIPVTVDIDECYDDDDRRFYVGEVTIKVQTKK